MLIVDSMLLSQVFGAIYEHNLALLHVYERARAIARTFYSLTIPLNNAHTSIMNTNTRTYIHTSKVINTHAKSIVFTDKFDFKHFVLDPRLVRP